MTAVLDNLEAVLLCLAGAYLTAQAVWRWWRRGADDRITERPEF